MPEVSVNVEVYCATCGNALCNQTESTIGKYRREPQFRVAACEKCCDAAKEEGDAEGYDRGYQDGKRDYEEASDA